MDDKPVLLVVHRTNTAKIKALKERSDKLAALLDLRLKNLPDGFVAMQSAKPEGQLHCWACGKRLVPAHPKKGTAAMHIGAVATLIDPSVQALLDKEVKPPDFLQPRILALCRKCAGPDEASALKVLSVLGAEMALMTLPPAGGAQT